MSNCLQHNCACAQKILLNWRNPQNVGVGRTLIFFPANSSVSGHFRVGRDGSDVRVGKQGGRCVRMHSVGPGVPKVQKPRRKSHQWEGDGAEVGEGSTPKGRRNKPVKVDTDSLQSYRCSPSRCTKPMRMESM